MEARPEPETKKEFSQLRSEQNTSILVHKCLQDRGLQWRLRVVVEFGRHVHYDYVYCLDAMKDGPPSMRQFSAERACWDWYQREILVLLADMRNMELIQGKLGFTRPSQNPVAADSALPWFVEEKTEARIIHTFAVALCQEEVWSQLMYVRTLPHALACILSENVEASNAQLASLRDIVQAIGEAEDRAKRYPLGNVTLSSTLESARFVGQQFAREIMCVGNVHGWTRNNQDLRKTAALMVDGSSTTADCLEKCFAHMQDVARPMKANTIDNYHLWFAASSSPWTLAGGMRQVETEFNDYINMAAEHANRFSVCQNLLTMKGPPGVL